MKIRDRAAAALDATHGAEMIGLQTKEYRFAIAEWLDGQRKFRARTVRFMCLALESAAQHLARKAHG